MIVQTICGKTLVHVSGAYVGDGAEVWWKSDEGPRKVPVKSHMDNITRFPHLYSLFEPEYTTETIYRYL